MKKVILMSIIALLIIYLVYNYNDPLLLHRMSLEIPISEARARRFGLIVDVRTPDERSQLGFFPNSVPLQMDKLHKIKTYSSNKATTILVYSNADHRAQTAANTLYQMGYQHVRYISSAYTHLLPGRFL
jgi:rhodanese-related sulfurtransferase